MSLVSTDWLQKNLDNVRIIDASWHMPITKRNAFDEYLKSHIEKAIFFDLDKNSNENSSLPHMLPNEKKWGKVVSDFGIKNTDHIVIYDSSEAFSSCRCWYSFIYFGHDPQKVSILNGGLKKWINEKKLVTNRIFKFNKSEYVVIENKSLVKNKHDIEKNIILKSFELVDARSEKRFNGLQPEPRPGLISGHIDNSKNIPFSKCINKDDHTFKSKEELVNLFEKHQIEQGKELVFTCGSGVTACVLGLANSIISGKTPIVYDGSWSEWGQLKNEKK
ncbi:MAG: sulfurtransferase [Pelagibacteraceae bacterium TMED287]|nr:MAG: sulfurtransferase [Pelagibacteraceae bacterium TMED287]